MKIRRVIRGSEVVPYGQQTGLPENMQSSGLEPSSSDGFTGVGSPAGGRVNSAPNMSMRHTEMYSFWLPVTNAPTYILGRNEMRSFLQIQNLGLLTVFLGFNILPGPAGQGGVELNPGFEIVFGYADGVPMGQVGAILLGAGTVNLSVLEGRNVGTW